MAELRADSESDVLYGHILRHARRFPDAPALSDGRAAMRYGDLTAEIQRMMAGLQEAGVRSGQLLAVTLSDPISHWIMLIAAEALGAATSSFSLRTLAMPALRRLLPRLDHLFSEREIPGLETGKLRLCTADWWQRVRTRPVETLPDFSDLPDRPEAWARIVQSSGTTGLPKNIMLSRAALARRVDHLVKTDALNAESRLLVSYPFSVGSLHLRAYGCMREGGSLVFCPTGMALAADAISHLWLLPNDLTTVLNGLPPTVPARPSLRLITAGGPLSAALRQRAEERLGCPALSYYGANEVGVGLAQVEADGIAQPLAGLELRLLEPGGIIALRWPGMAPGYLDDDEASARHFRDGWFITGDAGERQEDGRFRILGRADEMLTLGGLKVAPEQLEHALHQSLGHEVAAVMAVPGGDILLLGIVCPAGPDWNPLVNRALAEVKRLLPTWRGQLRLQRLEELPRAENGKLRRLGLREAGA